MLPLAMTKKDFIAIAAVLSANNSPLHTVLDMADMLEDSNPRFDRGLFVEASTGNLRKSLESDLRMLNKAVKE